MDFIKTFESFQYSIEDLSKLDEASIDVMFRDSFQSMLGGSKLTDKTPEEIKKNLKDKLSSIKSQYEASLTDYIKDKYDAKWYQPILDIVTAPASGFIKVTGTKSEDTEATKKREEAKKNAETKKAPEGLENLVEESPLVAGFLKNVALVALPKGMKLEEGMDTSNITPDTKELGKLLYDTSMETASKLFEEATKGLENLSSINFEFETVGAKIKKNNEKVYIMKGIYIFHWYRWPDPKNKSHLI
jgi:hypothetical protein